MIEIYLLEHLLAFHEYGTLSSAAEHLNIAQPSLSRSMQKLETILNVALFDRQKNRIALNETGKLAVQYAKRILDTETEMVRHIRAFDRSRHTLTIGSCAPGPLMELLPKATGTFPNMTVSSVIDTEDGLIQGLENSDYSFIILPNPVDREDLYCQECCTEHLYLSVTPFHPAASYQEVSFQDMDGQNFIMYAHVGFWEDIVREKMPHSKFFKQENLDTVSELTRYSDLPSFSSSITLKTMQHRHHDRVHVPFSDKESYAAFWLICNKENLTKLNALFRIL